MTCENCQKLHEQNQLILSGLRWTGDGYEWTGAEYDYRLKPEEAVQRMSAERVRLEDKIEHLLGMLREVYNHAGNHRPAKQRHVLPPGLRDRIRDEIGAEV